MSTVRTPLDADDIIKRYLAGESLIRLSDSIGCARKTIRQLLCAHDIPIRAHTVWTTLNANDVIRRYLAGESAEHLSRSIGHDRNVITLLLRKNGVPLRTQSEAERLKWSQKTPEQRAALMTAAHHGRRGQVDPPEVQVRRAVTREARGFTRSHWERELWSMLEERSIQFETQKRIGHYNCDVAIDPVAVEVLGGYYHLTNPRRWTAEEQRFRYLINAGWHILAIYVQPAFPLVSSAVDYLCAFMEGARRDPSARREYRVIRGNGEFVASGGVERNRFTIKYPTRHIYPIGRRYASRGR